MTQSTDQRPARIQQRDQHPDESLDGPCCRTAYDETRYIALQHTTRIYKAAIFRDWDLADYHLQQVQMLADHYEWTIGTATTIGTHLRTLATLARQFIEAHEP